MVKEILKKELEYFENHREELLGKAKGEYALIHDGKLIDTFRSKEDAIKRGYEDFGNAPFLVKLITDVEDALNFTNQLFSNLNHAVFYKPNSKFTQNWTGDRGHYFSTEISHRNSKDSAKPNTKAYKSTRND